MKLSEEEVRQLLDWFVTSSETKKRHAEGRKEALKENHKWIQPDVIQRMSDEELEARFLGYYKSGASRATLNQIYRDRIIRIKDRFRKTMLYLLDEGIDVTKRVDQILDGEHRIEGFGRAILTSFLMDYRPDKYCIWNNKTEMGFSVMGWEVYAPRDSKGTAYGKVLQRLQELAGLAPQLNLTFDDVDLFLHTISAEDEGTEVVRLLSEGREIPRPGAESGEQISEGSKNMKFAMERYLEEFIEANFGTINFGVPLELYQDEESNGRQFPTPIGNIDLLAVDRGEKEFVVIELKKGRSSDVVIGQILRYMGWVKEHLAKAYGTRGIIIAGEKDEKLEYALKLTPNVNLFLYTVSFELKRAI